MNTFPILAGLVALLPLAAGCAARTAPFNELDKAPMTIMRLGQQPAPVAPAAVPGLGGLIPGIPPELQQMGQAAMTGLQGILPPGILPPGLIPGASATAQPAQQLPVFKPGYAITAPPQTVSDDSIRNEILDIFGHADSFSTQRGNCFMPGMGVSIQRQNAPPVDLLISLSCNQAQGDGFRWPYPSNGFTTATHDRLSKLYEKLWGPVPAGA